MLRVKICGNHWEEDVLLLQEYQQLITDVGFIFTKKSKRYVSPEQVKEWLERYPFLATKAVAVFLEQDVEEILEILSITGIKRVQLHGEESPIFCQRLKEKNLEVWKAIHMEAGKVPSVSDYLQVVDCLLLDTKVGQQVGGTGTPFDWSKIAVIQTEVEGAVPIYVAGGITPDNIEALLGEHQVAGIDLASGVETDLRKDREKLSRLLEGVEQSGQK